MQDADLFSKFLCANSSALLEKQHITTTCTFTTVRYYLQFSIGSTFCRTFSQVFEYQQDITFLLLQLYHISTRHGDVNTLSMCFCLSGTLQIQSTRMSSSLGGDTKTGFRDTRGHLASLAATSMEEIKSHLVRLSVC